MRVGQGTDAVGATLASPAASIQSRPMPGYVAILEDDPVRLAEMRACLPELLPGHAPAFFDNAGEMIAWLGDHMQEVVLISLDHDLPLRQERGGQAVDAGTGRAVAD